jgi:hypothetical protein
MWPWIATAFGLGLGVGLCAVGLAHVDGDRLVRSLATFVDVDPGPTGPAPRAIPAVAAAAAATKPPAAPPRRPAAVSVPTRPAEAVRFQPSSTNARWRDDDAPRASDASRPARKPARAPAR